jgi:hypothetical protein
VELTLSWQASNAEVSLYERPSDSVPARSGDLAFTVGESMAYSSNAAVDLFAVLLFLASIQVIRDYGRRRGRPYPPGPRPLPIIGNLLDIPKQFSWLAYSNFSKAHGTTASFAYRGSVLTKMAGNILAFHIFGQVIVVLNTAKAARDLLEKRSAIYSDRPVMPFYEMCVLESFRWGFWLNYNQDGLELGYASCKKRRPLAPRTQGA